MTDRPRAWTIVDFGDQIRAVGPSLARPNHVDVVEWDREKVLPVIMAAIQTYLQAGEGDTYDPRGEADAIFDALDREQT